MVSTRKVNKPRLSLRKEEKKVLHRKLRGVVPALLYFGADMKLILTHTPEQVLNMLGLYVAGDITYLMLPKSKQNQFRTYLKKHGYEDFTKKENVDEEEARSATTCNARSRKDNRE